jgi:hypothetical protein
MVTLIQTYFIGREQQKLLKWCNVLLLQPKSSVHMKAVLSEQMLIYCFLTHFRVRTHFFWGVILWEILGVNLGGNFGG